MYIVYECKTKRLTTHFALTEEQLNDEKSKVLFEEGEVKEFARVNTIKEMHHLDTPHRIAYLKNGKIQFA